MTSAAGARSSESPIVQSPVTAAFTDRIVTSRRCDRNAPCQRCVAGKRTCTTHDTLMRRGPLTREQRAVFAFSGITYESHRERMKKRRLLQQAQQVTSPLGVGPQSMPGHGGMMASAGFPPTPGAVSAQHGTHAVSAALAAPGTGVGAGPPPPPSPTEAYPDPVTQAERSYDSAMMAASGQPPYVLQGHAAPHSYPAHALGGGARPSLGSYTDAVAVHDRARPIQSMVGWHTAYPGHTAVPSSYY